MLSHDDPRVEVDPDEWMAKRLFKAGESAMAQGCRDWIDAGMSHSDALDHFQRIYMDAERVHG